MNGRRGEGELAVLIGHSAELKRDLVDFARGPRLARSLAAAMAEAGLDELGEADAIGVIDRFALQYRMRDGQTVVDRFVASRPDLDYRREPRPGVSVIGARLLELASDGRR